MARHGGRSIETHDPGAASGSGTTTKYFSTDRAIILRNLALIGINPAAADADTFSAVIDYSVAGAAFVACGTVAAVEYNDTDNTLALTALVPNNKITDGNFTVARIPADALVRMRQIWTGTVTDGHVVTSVTYDIV